MLEAGEAQHFNLLVITAEIDW